MENEIENIYEYYGQLTGDKKKIKLDFIYPVPQNRFYSKKNITSLYDKKSSFRKRQARCRGRGW